MVTFYSTMVIKDIGTVAAIHFYSRQIRTTAIMTKLVGVCHFYRLHAISVANISATSNASNKIERGRRRRMINWTHDILRFFLLLGTFSVYAAAFRPLYRIHITHNRCVFVDVFLSFFPLSHPLRMMRRIDCVIVGGEI